MSVENFAGLALRVFTVRAEVLHGMYSRSEISYDRLAALCI